jgi:hypothetical protein
MARWLLNLANTPPLQQPNTTHLTLGAHSSKGLQAAPGTGSLLALE